jgi:hypothetical protein
MAEAQEQEALRALLRDLNDLSAYLHGRGQNAYQLAQRFLENAQREKDQQTRAFDEQQAKMLDYQHYIWHEIAGMVEKLTNQYQRGASGQPDDGEQGSARRRGAHLAEQETAG